MYAFQWDYDLVGNRAYESRDGAETYYEYNAGNQLTRSHELAGDTWTYFAYDARGNCLRTDEPDGTTYFEYTAADMVSSIRYKTGASNYFHYDASLRRYAMEDSAGLSYFTWDDDGMELLAERDSSAAVTAGYTHGETPIGGIGTLVAAAKDAGGGSTEYQYPIYDHRGSVVRLVDETGTVTATYEYDAWGNVLQDTETITTGSRFGYQSDWIRLADSNGRLCLSPMRLYDVRVGRWLQRDPIGYQDGPNLYEYCLSTPVDDSDALGLSVGTLFEEMGGYAQGLAEDQVILRGWILRQVPPLFAQALYLTGRRLTAWGTTSKIITYGINVTELASFAIGLGGGSKAAAWTVRGVRWGIYVADDAEQKILRDVFKMGMKKGLGKILQRTIAMVPNGEKVAEKFGELLESGGPVAEHLKKDVEDDVTSAVVDAIPKGIKSAYEFFVENSPIKQHKTWVVKKKEYAFNKFIGVQWKGPKGTWDVSGSVHYVEFKEGSQPNHAGKTLPGFVQGRMEGHGCDPKTGKKKPWYVAFRIWVTKKGALTSMTAGGVLAKRGYGQYGPTLWTIPQIPGNTTNPDEITLRGT